MTTSVSFQHFISLMHQLPGAQPFQKDIEQFAQLMMETDLPQSIGENEILALRSDKVSFSEQGLQFDSSASSLQKAVSFDFDEDASYARSNQRGKNDLLLKAIGYKNQPLRVLDLTAGLLRDAVFMAQTGCQVTSLERNFLLYLCLSWGLMKAKADFVNNLNLLYSEAADFLKSHNLLPYDAIFYDPMYPETKSTALPKKEIQFLREFIGEDQDREQTVQLILNANIKSRVVVKRHPQEKKSVLKSGPAIKGHQTVMFEGKAVLFEVYIPASKSSAKS